MEIKKKVVICNGEIHYEISNGEQTISCDVNEVTETINELLNLQSKRMEV